MNVKMKGSGQDRSNSFTFHGRCDRAKIAPANWLLVEMHVIAALITAGLGSFPGANTASTTTGADAYSLQGGPTSADAESSAPAPIPTPFDHDGYSAMVRVVAGDCLVGSNIDLPTMLAMTADLQKRGLIRSQVDSAHVAAHAWTTASAIALNLQPFLIVNLFKDHPEVKRCGFVQTVTGMDGKQELAYAFDMTRTAYARVKWPSYSPDELPRISEGFRVGSSMAEHMNAEAKK